MGHWINFSQKIAIWYKCPITLFSPSSLFIYQIIFVNLRLNSTLQGILLNNGILSVSLEQLQKFQQLEKSETAFFFRWAFIVTCLNSWTILYQVIWYVAMATELNIDSATWKPQAKEWNKLLVVKYVQERFFILLITSDTLFQQQQQQQQ